MLQPAPAEPTNLAATENRDALVDAIVGFLREIGLPVRFAAVEDATFLPGLRIERGALVVDRAKLAYPGDLLHEGAHLAVRSPRRRAAADGNLDADGGEELTAIAWSYAAVVHLGLDPALLFHEHGYRGAGAALRTNFERGTYFGVAPLARLGLTSEPRRADVEGHAPYPAMRAWLNDGVLDDE